MNTSTLAIIFFYAFIVLILPALGANSAFKKNRRKLGVYIIVTALLGIGWILAIAALIQPYNLIEKEISTPCPKCGGTKGDELHALIDRHTQKPTISLAQAIAWGIFAIVLIGGSIWFVIFTWSAIDDFLAQILWSITFISVGISLGRIGVMAIIDYQKAERVRGTIFHCSQCKYEWTNVSG